MDLWETPVTVNDALPDGLPEDDTLCLVALGFHLNSDGTMREELIERLKVLLAESRKYPNAVIVCTGGPTAAGDPDAMARLAQSEAALGGALSRLLVTVERYPELKANQNFLELQEELTATENKVAFARQAYNDAVTEFNNARSVFPTVLLAGAFGFPEAKLLEVESAEIREAPKVSF